MRLREKFKIWVFLEKNGLFEKMLEFFFKISKGGKFAVKCVSNGFFLKNCVFRPNCEVF